MALICALAVVASPLYAEIDFSCGPMRMPEVTQRLSKASGVSLGAASSLADEVLFISATKTTPKALMDRMAQALDANWVQHGESFTLERPANWEQCAATMRTAFFAGMIEADIRKHPAVPKITDADLIQRARAARELRDREKQMTMAGLTAFQAVTPAGRLLDQILVTVKPTVLARDPEHKIVFSDHPNRLQLALPRLDRLLTEFYAAHNRVAVEMEQQVATNQLRWGPDNALDAWRVVDPQKAKILLVVTGTPSPTITLKVVQDGDLAAYAQRNLIQFDGEAPKALGTAKLNAASVEFLRKRVPNTIGGYVLKAEQRPAFRKATENEFLRFGNEEGLAALGEREKRNVVAVVPDDALLMPHFVGQKDELDLALYERILTFLRLERRIEDNWLVYRSAYPTPRLSRTLIEGAFKEAQSEGRLSVGLWGRLMDRDAVGHPRLFSELLSLGGQAMPSDLIQTANSARLLARLDSAQLDALRGGRVLSGSDLSPAQQELAENAVRNDDNLSLKTKTRGSGFRFFSLERTEMFPAGFRDGSSSIQAQFISQPDSFLLEFPGEGAERIQTAEAGLLGTLWAYFERPELFGGGKRISPENATYYRGSALDILLTFDGGSDVSLMAQFSDVVPDRTKPLTYKDLPAELRDDAQAQKKERIENYQRYRKDGGGN